MSKELCDETGYSYFGARYYDPNISIWLSVDPLSEKYPGLSPYNYVLNNPVRLVDPDGAEAIIPPHFWTSVYVLYANNLENNGTEASTKQTGYVMANLDYAFHVRFRINVPATNFQVNIGKAIGFPQNGDGTPQNAIRHTLWQALISRDLGADHARRIGNAHEDTREVDLGQRSFDDLGDADYVADQLNNLIGRKIGSENKGASNKTLAREVMRQYHEKGLWTVSGNEKDGFTLERTKITAEQYKAAMQEINRKGEGGLNE